MVNTQLRDIEVFEQERPGALILSSTWNQNFNRIREVANENNATIKANFDRINARTVPAEALEILGQTDVSNIMEQIVLIATILNAKANTEDVVGDMSNFYDDISYDKTTGTFTFIKRDGSVLEVDTLLEKVPVSMELLTIENDVYLRVTNDDGSYTETPVSDLVSDYNFISTDTIACTVSQKDSNYNFYEVQFQIKKNSITEDYLDPAVLSLIKTTATDITALVETAKTAAQNASNSEANANESKNAAALSAMQAEEAFDDAYESALLAKSYAEGGSGIRENENYDNAKYWYEQAKKIGDNEELKTHVNDTDIHITPEEREKWNDSTGTSLVIENVTVPASGWVDERETTAMWRCRLYNEAILEGMRVEVEFNMHDETEELPNSYVRATNGGVLAGVTSNAGYVDVYAADGNSDSGIVAPPTTDLVCDLVLTQLKVV